MRKTIVMAAILLGILGLVVVLLTWQRPAQTVEESVAPSTKVAQPEPGSVSGRVLRSDGLPIPNAVVTVGDSTAKTDESGRYILAGLSAGETRVDATAPGWVSPGPAEERGLKVNVDPEAALSGMDLVLREPARIQGKILAGGTPVEGASIGLFYMHADGVDGRAVAPFALDAIATSGKGGVFDTGTIAPGRLRVLVEHEGFALLESRQLFLREAQTWPNLRLDLAPSTALTLQVLTKEGTPVRAEVILTGASLPRARRLKVPSTGEVKFEALPAGDLVVTASAPGFRKVRVPTTVELGERNQADVVMEPASGIFGRVVDRMERPVAGASLLLYGKENERKYLKTDASGWFSWDDAPERRWMVDVASHQHEGVYNFPIATGEEAVIRLGRGGRIRGSVVTSAGAPVQSFTLAVEEYSGKRPWLTRTRSFPKPPISRADGTFDYGDLKPGTYYLRVSPRTFGDRVVGPIEVTSGGVAGPVRVVVEAAGKVRGVVRSSKGGAPIAGASVEVFEPMSSLPRRRTRTRADGSFALESVSPGRRSVRVVHRGYMTQVVAGVEVSSAQTATREISLEPAAPGARFAFHGIGASLAKAPEGVVIKEIMEGSPSQAFGLEKGDVIVSVDGKESSEMRFTDVINSIRGEEGVPVAIEVLREGQGRMTIDVERGRVVVKDRRRGRPSRPQR